MDSIALPRLPSPSPRPGIHPTLAYRIIIRHPHYDAHNNVLLVLQAPDAPAGGLSQSLCHSICALLTGNRDDGFLSKSVDGAALGSSAAFILPAGVYYFHVPDSSPREPYPVVPTFAHWPFPDCLPPPWQQLAVELSDTPAARSDTSAQIFSRDTSCRITGHCEGVEIAHLVPRAQSPWFHQNQMDLYISDSRRSGLSAVDDASNVLLLRADVHRVFDRLKMVFVPKQESPDSAAVLVVHVLAASKELVNLYHNVQLRLLRDIRPEFLLARLALSVFPLIEGFLCRNVPRRLAVLAKDGSLETRWFTGDECTALVNPPKSRSSSPQKRPHPGFGVPQEADVAEGVVACAKRRLSGAGDAAPCVKKGRWLVDSPQSPQSGQLHSSSISSPHTESPLTPPAVACSNSTKDPDEKESGKSMGYSNGEAAKPPLQSLRERFLSEERNRSGDRGRWSEERERWLGHAMNRTLFSEDMPRLFKYWGYDG